MIVLCLGMKNEINKTLLILTILKMSQINTDIGLSVCPCFCTHLSTTYQCSYDKFKDNLRLYHILKIVID